MRAADQTEVGSLTVDRSAEERLSAPTRISRATPASTAPRRYLDERPDEPLVGGAMRLSRPSLVSRAPAPQIPVGPSSRQFSAGYGIQFRRAAARPGHRHPVMKAPREFLPQPLCHCRTGRRHRPQHLAVSMSTPSPHSLSLRADMLCRSVTARLRRASASPSMPAPTAQHFFFPREFFQHFAHP